VSITTADDVGACTAANSVPLIATLDAVRRRISVDNDSVSTEFSIDKVVITLTESVVLASAGLDVIVSPVRRDNVVPGATRNVVATRRAFADQASPRTIDGLRSDNAD
jgi:hypothetical protein